MSSTLSGIWMQLRVWSECFETFFEHDREGKFGGLGGRQA
jgi:hypothetical protein